MDGTTRPPRWRERMGVEEFGNKIEGDGSPDDLVGWSISCPLRVPWIVSDPFLACVCSL